MTLLDGFPEVPELPPLPDPGVTLTPPPFMQAQVHTASRRVIATGLFPSGGSIPGVEIVPLTAEQCAEMNQPGQAFLAVDGTVTVEPPPDPPEPEISPASILMLMLADVEDISESKDILMLMLQLLGGVPPEE